MNTKSFVLAVVIALICISCLSNGKTRIIKREDGLYEVQRRYSDWRQDEVKGPFKTLPEARAVALRW